MQNLDVSTFLPFTEIQPSEALSFGFNSALGCESKPSQKTRSWSPKGRLEANIIATLATALNQ